MLPTLSTLAQMSDALQHRPLVAVPLLFFAGLVTSLNPCIWPMIPITAGTIGGVGGTQASGTTSRRRAIALTLTYVLGLALFYALLGLIAGLSGTMFGTISANRWALLAIGNLLLVFALAMFEVIPIRMPARLAAWAGSLGGGSYPAVFLLGVTSGIVAAPCGAPAFAAVLTWVATTHSAVLGFIYLFVFSLGMTAVLVLVGVFSGALAMLPKPGTWMLWIKRGAGMVLLLMAEYYFVRAGLVW
ncbi:MAG TPA: cytochrome c biogenesis protein CcdA [Gemmatimonadales bacterium]|nr:cytochrome c biogenesis protein CcdA [Gemmatimonadales bacterium]